MSTISTRYPSSESATARFSVDVVLATPPFWFANAITTASRGGASGAPSGVSSTASAIGGREKRPARRISSLSFGLGPECPAHHQCARKTGLRQVGELNFSVISGAEAPPPPVRRPVRRGSRRGPRPLRAARARRGATSRPRGPARAARREARPPEPRLARAPRCARAVAEVLVPRPCERTYRQRAHVSVSSLSLKCADREGRFRLNSGLRSKSEQRLVEPAEELLPLPMLEHGDERAPDEIADRARRIAGCQEAETVEDRCAFPRRLAEQGRGSERRGEEPLAATEQRREGSTQLLRCEGIGLKEGELPAVERLAELAVVV